jgi:hypothetical protein
MRTRIEERQKEENDEGKDRQDPARDGALNQPQRSTFHERMPSTAL